MDEHGIESGGMSEILDEYKRARFSERGVNKDGMENGHTKWNWEHWNNIKGELRIWRLHWLLAFAIER